LKELRAGSTDEVLSAATQRLEQGAANISEFESTSVDNITDTVLQEFVEKSEHVRERAAWLLGETQGSSVAASLTSTLQNVRDKAANFVEQHGGQLKLRTFLSQASTICEEANAQGGITDKQIQEMLKSLEGCRGLQVSGEEASIVHCLLAHLQENPPTDSACDLALLFLKLVDPNAMDTSEFGLWEHSESEWSLLRHGLKITGLMSQPEADRLNNEWRVSAAETLKLWDGVAASHTITQEKTKAFQTSVDSLRTAFHSQHEEAALQAAADLTAALDDVEKNVKGLNGESWKAKLTGESTWEDVQREAAYHLFPIGKPSIIKVLDDKYVAAEQARERWEIARKPLGTPMPQDMETRLKRVLNSARVTSADAYFIETLSSTPQGKIKTKGRRRIASMGQPAKQVDVDDLFPLLWQEVNDVNKQ